MILVQGIGYRKLPILLTTAATDCYTIFSAAFQFDAASEWSKGRFVRHSMDYLQTLGFHPVRGGYYHTVGPILQAM